MADDALEQEQLPDELPGYTVNFHVYSTGVTATVSEIAYRRGRRRLVGTYRLGRAVDLPLGTGPRADVAFLCGQLRDWLLYDA